MQQLAKFLRIVQSVMVDWMPPFLDPSIASPISESVLRHAKKLSGLLNGHELAQFRHRIFPDQKCRRRLHSTQPAKPYQR